MTKQHLVAFASEIKIRFSLTTLEQFTNRPDYSQDAVEKAIAIVCTVAASFNPRFDETRFRAACFAK